MEVTKTSQGHCHPMLLPDDHRVKLLLYLTEYTRLVPLEYMNDKAIVVIFFARQLSLPKKILVNMGEDNV